MQAAPPLLHRLILLALALPLWMGAALYAAAVPPLPDLAAGLTFLLTLWAGPVALLVPALAWLLYLVADSVPAALADPRLLALHIAVYGAFAIAVRHSGCSGCPRGLREVLASLFAAASAAALFAALASLFAAGALPAPVFVAAAGQQWLAAASGLLLVLPAYWYGVATDLPRRSGWVLLPALACAGAGCAGALWLAASWPAAALLALLTAGVLIGAWVAAAGAGIGGVAAYGLVLAALTLWLAARPALLQPWPVWFAVLLLAQTGAIALAVLVESRQRLAAREQAGALDAQRREAAALFDLLNAHSSDIISVHDAAFNFVHASPQLHQWLGLAAEERPAAIADFLPRLHPAERPVLRPEQIAAVASAPGRFRFRIRGGDHQWHWMESAYAPVGTGAERRYVVITRDVGAHVEQTESLYSMALHDPLTHLYNRRGATSLGTHAFEEAVTQRTAFAVVVLDIDHFKQVNDRYGHDAGDEVIKCVAGILTSHCRQRDIVCRWGGEEFLMLLPESDIDGAILIAERVRGEVASTAVVTAEASIRINISAGVTELEQGSADLGELIERADRGLYAAKEQGRNRVVPMVGGGT